LSFSKLVSAVLILLSPAKTLDFDTPPVIPDHSLPGFIDQSARLIAALRKLRPATLGKLMDISPALAELNVARYQAWTPVFTPLNAKQAVLAFNGDVYDGLQAPQLSAEELAYTQDHLRILSGLYGVLRPLDLIQPYRLEMGTRLATGEKPDLYAYWGDTVTRELNGLLATRERPVVLNLASQEYFRVVQAAKLKAPVITPVFEDWKSGKYKIISFFAKRARGLMARFALVNRLDRVEQLKDFAGGGYAFAPEVSGERNWVFRRRVGAA